MKKLLSFFTFNILLLNIYAQCPIFQETFNSSLGQFTAANGVNGNWIFTTSCSQSSASGHSAPGSALFQGSGCDFGNGSLTVSGNLVSPSISIPSTGATLSFNYYVNNECFSVPCTYDVLTVQISNNGGSSFTNIFSTNSNPGGLLFGGWHNVTYNLSSYAGQNIILRFNFNSIDGIANNYDGIYIDDVIITALCPYPNDAGIASIDTPYVPTCSVGNSNIVVTLENLGTDTLFNCTINWEVNGVPQTPYNWSGAIAPLQTLANVVIGNYTFSNGDILKVYTSNPNGVNDSIPSNDTAMITLTPSLSGTYYIGGPTANYPGFTAAVNALNNFGVCGPVTFIVHDSTFNEQITLTTVQGMSATNTVTFKGKNLNSVLTFASTSTSDNYVIKFDGGASHFRIDSLQIVNTGSTYAYVLHFNGGENNITIKNCILMNDTNNTSTSTNKTVVYKGSGTPANNIKFLNNTIKGGSYGIYWYGQSTTNRNTNTVFDGNKFMMQYYGPLYVYYADGLSFNNNYVTASINYSSTIYLAYFYYIDKISSVQKNKFIFNKPSGFVYGLYMYQANGTPSNPALFANNFIAIGDSANSSTGYGIYASTCSYINLYNNNISIPNTGTTYPIYLTGGGGFNIYNNNIAARKTTGGYAIYISGAFINNMDYNNYFIPASSNFGYFGTAYPSLYAWQINTGFDANSLSVNPKFYSDFDLHSCQDSLAGAGMHIAAISTDIDGNPRNPNYPFIGADVFANPASNNFLGPDIEKCPGDTVTIGFPEPNGTFAWLPTGDTTATIQVVNPGTYTLNASNACGTGFDNIKITNIPDPVADFSYTGSQFIYTFNNTSTNASSYFWDFGDGNTSTDMNPTHVYASGDTHTVTLIAYGQCTSDTVTYTIPGSPNAINETDAASLAVYPNPNNGLINVRFNRVWSNATLEILNTQGQVVFRQVIKANNGEVLPVDLTNQAKGIYFLKLQDDQSAIIKKLIIE